MSAVKETSASEEMPDEEIKNAMEKVKAAAAAADPMSMRSRCSRCTKC